MINTVINVINTPIYARVTLLACWMNWLHFSTNFYVDIKEYLESFKSDPDYTEDMFVLYSGARWQDVIVKCSRTISFYNRLRLFLSILIGLNKKARCICDLVCMCMQYMKSVLHFFSNNWLWLLLIWKKILIKCSYYNGLWNGLWNAK